MDSSFDEVVSVLEQAGADITPAELQGFLCGHLATGSRDHNSWLRHAAGFLDVGELKPDVKAFLISLFDKNETYIKEADFEFELLLPDEDEELSIRVLCVGQWCQGFLTSFGMGCSDDRARALSEDTQGALSDFVAISQISNDVEDNNVAEGAYTDIVEYIRMAVLSVAMECRQPPTTELPDTPVH